jgi:predicted ATPase
MALDHVAHELHTRIEWRGSPYHQQSALYPVIDHLHRLLRWCQDTPLAETLHTLEAALAASGVERSEAVPLLAALLSLSLPASYPPLTLTPQRQRQKTLDTLLAWLHAEARRQPVLMIVEDLHWVDPSTLELLSRFIDQGAHARLCLVLTYRPEFHPPWAMAAHLTALTLSRFALAQVERLATSVAGGKALPPAVLQEVVRKTDGVPLFVEELTKTVLESGLLHEQADHYALPGPLPPLAIPATLHDALMARLDRLATVKVVAQLGATIGRTFAYDLLEAVAPLDVATLHGALAQLVEAEVVMQRGLPPQATYTFKHALIQDAAYQSLLRSTRQQYHQRMAQVLEAQFPETVETQPELVAQHYTEAGWTAQAIPYWQRAGERAIARAAHGEAISHLTQALAGLQTQADTPARTEHELTVLTTLGPVLVAIQGYIAPDVEQTYTRAYALCQQLGETPHLLPVLAGLRRFYTLVNEFQKGRELAEWLLALAHRVHNPVFLVEAHFALGNNAFFPGEVVDAHAHFEQGLVLYQALPQRPSTPQSAQDPGVSCLSYAAFTAWLLGYPDQARRWSQEAVTLAQALAHPHTLAFALSWAGLVHIHRREVQAAHERAEVLFPLADEYGLSWLETGAFLRGWVLVARGQREAGIALMSWGEAQRQALHRAGLRLVQPPQGEAPGTRHQREVVVNTPYYIALIAEAYGTGGQTAEGLAVVAEAQALVDTMGGHYYAAELYRLKGELLLAHAAEHHVEAITCFQHALTIARRQQVKSLELRAATSLARLWQQQGQRAEAYELLAPVYGWFTEGFDTADLQEAKALLDALA